MSFGWTELLKATAFNNFQARVTKHHLKKQQRDNLSSIKTTGND